MSGKRREPMRKCIGCGEMKGKKELIRVLKTPEDAFLLDATGRKNGRGAYLCKDAACLEKAIRQKGLERSFQAAIPPDVYDSLRKELARLEAE
ncbi:MAG: YlxR family protein [Lachnospiraceae bacterium]|nr:YlxR family protein [Lachnospiraceae bacterium]